VEKYGRDRQATDDNIKLRMRFECWITKATDTHSEYVTLIAVHNCNRYGLVAAKLDSFTPGSETLAVLAVH
jgi:hypothetical protein